jgi:16S rRNA (cytidine1402-2'-O)-methyltransferase
MSNTGILYIVATPIGNLEDITYRAVRTLNEVDIIACEDTRNSRKLLDHFGINKKLLRFFDHSTSHEQTKILDHLVSGRSIALISDAGTPLISDPDYTLIRAAQEAGITISPIPGPSALSAAISVSGLPSDNFTFLGFLPNAVEAAKKKLLNYKELHSTLVIYESPNRLLDSLKLIHATLGDRECCVARELTKLFEEIKRESLSILIDEYELVEKIRGECVILISGDFQDIVITDEQIQAELKKELALGNSMKDSVANVSKTFSLARKRVYDLALKS